MTDSDVGLVAVLFVGVAALGYLLGRRTGTTRDEVAKVGAKPQAPKPTPAKPDPKEQRKVAPVEEPRVVVSEAVDLPDMNPNEGEDELDVTRVGAATSGPPPAARRTIYQPPLERIVFDPEAEEEEPDHAESMFLVHATAQTDTGLRRKHNEDSVLVLEAANLFVVADGMGGYKGGQLASQLVIRTMAEAARTREYEGPPHEEVPLEASELARAIQMSNAEIQEEVARRPDLQGMGTTVCAARFSPNKRRLYVGHVGDSRCYRLRDAVFTMMTADHTMASHGVKGPESAHLSRAVGIWPTVPIDILMAVPQLGDVYLLCSDGLTKMLNDDVIANVLRSEEDPKAAVDRLILFANSRGGKDNITVVLVRVVPSKWKPRAPSSPG